MKRRILLICCALLALSVAPAFAGGGTPGGVNLAWTDCGAAGQQDRVFACNVNTGNNTLVVSYSPNTTMPDMVGNDIRVDLMSADASTLNDWWQMFNVGTCRGTTVPTTNVVFGAGTCADFWAGGGAGGIGSYNISGNRASLLMFWAVAAPAQADAGTEYYSINIVINNTRTVGTGSCAGCATPVCLVANVVTMTTAGIGLQALEDPLDRNWVTWQGGTGVVGGCPGTVPTTNKTWGQVKALYR